jgi:hypothetical protein
MGRSCPQAVDALRALLVESCRAPQPLLPQIGVLGTGCMLEPNPLKAPPLLGFLHGYGGFFDVRY